MLVILLNIFQLKMYKFILSNYFTIVILIIIGNNFINCHNNTDEYKTYNGYKLYTILPQKFEHIHFLRNQELNNENIDVFLLTKLINSTAEIMVRPMYQRLFEESLQMHNIPFKIKIDNIEKFISYENNHHKRQKKSINILPKSTSSSSSNKILNFKNYLRFNDINKYLNKLSEIYSDNVEIINVGKSFENRDINIVKISNNLHTTENKKKSIFIDAGIHAREWIAPATALYIIHELLENSIENQFLLDTFEWIILPIVNPDGYEYTHTNDRLWRKTRKFSNRNCVGVDGNRNFDYHWGEIGASTNQCAENYQGERPLSEPETQIIHNVMDKIKHECKLYLTLHSFGNYLLYPWGFTSELPNTWKDMDDVALAGANAIKQATGTNYIVGSSTNVLYAAAGGSDDYAHGKHNINVALTMELPAGGSFGFNPSPNNILSIVKESWIGIKAMALKIAEKY